MASPALRTPFELELERHRRDLTGYCYRMLGSGSEAEDAVQDTFVKAWKKAGTLQEAAALRSWLYRIAHNVCLDMLQTTQRRARPMDLVGPGTPDGDLAPLPESAWVQPVASAAVLPDDPAELTAQRETVRLAFVAALQHLPPKQRAVLILREVLRWSAAETAELLDTSVAGVNSALQRARATVDGLQLDSHTGTSVAGEAHEQLFRRYVEAFEEFDVDALVALLAEDAQWTMPPFGLWLQGREDVRKFLRGAGAQCRGSRVAVLSANGLPALAWWKPADDGDGHEAWGIGVLESDGRQITGVHQFIGDEHFEQLGLPTRLAAGAPLPEPAA